LRISAKPNKDSGRITTPGEQISVPTPAPSPLNK
jgi:hypothetical protein